MIEYDSEKIEKLQKELASAISAAAKAKEQNLDKSLIEVLEEIIQDKEKELSHFLQLIVVEDELNERTNFYLKKNSKEIHLNALFEDPIVDSPEILSNNLVSITVCNWNGLDLSGIFSFNQEKLICPFVIENISEEDDAYFFLTLDEHWSTASLEDSILDDELNLENNFLYLNADGSIFQNEGHLVEQISPEHYILEYPDESSQYMLFGPSDLDAKIAIDAIMQYDFSEEFNTVIFKTKNHVGVFDLKESTILFKKEGTINIEQLNSQLFQCSVSNYYQIISKEGAIVFQYALHNSSGDDTNVEFYIEGRFYKADFSNLNISSDCITIKAFDVTKEKTVIINIESGIPSILAVDIDELNRLLEGQLESDSQNRQQISNFIHSAIKNGAKFQVFDFYHDHELIKKAFPPSCHDLIENKVRDFLSKFPEVHMRFTDSELEELNWGLIKEVNILTKTYKFQNGSFLFIGKSGVLRHLLINHTHLFSDNF
jgi:hypothetical protein